MTDRAVSEVVAFVLVFAIVISSIGLLYAVGFDGIANLQEAERDDSANQAFEALAIGFDDVQRDTRSKLEVSLDLSGGSLSVDDSSELDVTVNGDAPSNTTTNGSALVYTASGTDIVYENGAVIRSDESGGEIVTRAPRFRCRPDADRAVVSLFTIEDDFGGISSSGELTFDVEATDDADDSRLLFQRTDADEVRIDFSDSNYEDAWESYFEEAEGWELDAGDGVCEVDGSPSSEGTVFVRSTEVTMELEGEFGES